MKLKMGAVLDKYRRKTEGRSLLGQNSDSVPSYTEAGEASGKKYEDDSNNDSTEKPPPPDEKEVVNKQKSLKWQVVGYCLVLFVACMQVLSKAAVQTLAKSIPGAELNIFRYMAQPFLATMIMCSKRSMDFTVPRDKIKYVILMGFLNNFINMGGYGAAYYLPIATVTAIRFGLSAVGLWLLYMIVFKTIKLHVTLAVPVTIVGAVLITQPYFLFHNTVPEVNTTLTCYTRCGYDGPVIMTARAEPPSNTTACANHTRYGSSTNATDCTTESALPGNPFGLSDEGIGYLLLISSILCSNAQKILLYNKLKDVGVIPLNIWVPIIGMLMSAFLMGVIENPALPSCWFCMVILVIHATSAGLASIVRWFCLQMIHPVIFTLIIVIDIPMSISLEYTVLAHTVPGYTNAYEYVGLLVLLGGILLGPVVEVYLMHRQTKQQGSKQPERTVEEHEDVENENENEKKTAQTSDDDERNEDTNKLTEP